MFATGTEVVIDTNYPWDCPEDGWTGIVTSKIPTNGDDVTVCITSPVEQRGYCLSYKNSSVKAI